ncbi:MAG: cytochrome b/b6 domain-containing protein [Lautropia sp.]
MANSSSPEPAASARQRGVSAAAGAAIPVRVRVWDLPLRLFHWLLVVCVIGAFVTIKTGRTEQHLLFGYAALTLIVFRVLWGFVGPRYARFASFVYSPAALLAYLRGAPDAPRPLGHSPLGALSVFALLAIIGAQAVLGLFTSDDLLFEGPLARFVSGTFVERASGLHHLNERLIMALVALHLLAIVCYKLFRRTPLTRAMIDGDKRLVPDPAAAPQAREPAALAARDDAAIRLRALVVIAVAIAIVAAVVNWPAS